MSRELSEREAAPDFYARSAHMTNTGYLQRRGKAEEGRPMSRVRTLDNLITHAIRLLLLGLCVGLASVWAASIRGGGPGWVEDSDFGYVYFGARCALEHKDPYDPQELISDFTKGEGRTETRELRFLGLEVYLPSTMLLTAPFAMLPWPVAKALMMITTDCLLVVAAYLAWDLAGRVPVMAGLMACFILFNSVILLEVENFAGVAISLCIIATWCFLKERWAAAGVLLLALSLAIKPHDAGFIWLYFFLAGGPTRRRALQALAITLILGVWGAVWVARFSPDWAGELHDNLKIFAARGNLNDPGPLGSTSRSFGPIISLQNGLSVLKDEPRFYDPLSYAIGGGLILGWSIAVLRKRSGPEGRLLALGAISILTLLPVYHRTYDAKLLLLTIPACGALWGSGKASRWAALWLSAAAILVTGDLPVIYLSIFTRKWPVLASTLTGKAELLLLQPAPAVLLAAGCFYLWVYVGYKPSQAGHAEGNDAVSKAAEATAT